MSTFLRDLSQAALADAKKAGASSAEVLVSTSDGLSIEARQGDVETVEKGSSRDFDITVYYGQRKGSATSSGLSQGSIDKAIKAACEIAGQTTEDPCAGLAPAELMASGTFDLDVDHPWSIEVKDAIDKAVACEDAMRKHPDIINSDGVTVSTDRVVGVYANSHGFSGDYSETFHSISAIAVAGDDTQMQRDYWMSCDRNHALLETPQAVGEHAAERAASRLNARKIKTLKTPVVFAPEIARGLVSLFANSVSGDLLYKNASFMRDSLGTTCFPSFINIVEYPHLRGALGSAVFDDEGVATPQTRVFVESGVVKNYVLNSYSARKLKMTSTGNSGGMHNLCLESDETKQPALSFDELLAHMGTGVLITELIGPGINLVTGDYSRGAVGFMVENGRISYPVEEIAIAGNLGTMFKSIRAIGNDVDTRGSIRSGSILIDDMTVAGD